MFGFTVYFVSEYKCNTKICLNLNQNTPQMKCGVIAKPIII